jgi:hypothetical protein
MGHSKLCRPRIERMADGRLGSGTLDGVASREGASARVLRVLGGAKLTVFGTITAESEARWFSGRDDWIQSRAPDRAIAEFNGGLERTCSDRRGRGVPNREVGGRGPAKAHR